MSAIKLRLLKPPTDNGHAYEAGAEIEVDDATAHWLVNNQVAELPPADPGLPVLPNS